VGDTCAVTDGDEDEDGDKGGNWGIIGMVMICEYGNMGVHGYENAMAA
jgi:hypothetical protein